MMMRSLAMISALFAAVMWFSYSGQAYADSPRVGEVTAQEGPAALVRESAQTNLQVGAEVREMDRIVTEPRSRVRIGFLDGSSLNVGPGSEVVITTYAMGEDGKRQKGIFTLILGIIRATAEKAGVANSFEIETAAAVASARATSWIVEATAQETAVLVLSGKVEVMGRTTDPSIFLGPGEGTTVPLGSPPGAAKTWGDAKRERAVSLTEIP